ncbi:MAG: hypothetical protein AB1746_06005 [Candidatus Zixiibacteriota bacterium]
MRSLFRIIGFVMLPAVLVMLILPAGCDQDNSVTSSSSGGRETVWVDNFNAIGIPFMVVDSLGIIDGPIIIGKPAIDTVQNIPMKSVLTLGDSLFDVKVFGHEDTLVAHHSGYYRMSRDTLYIYCDDGVNKVFGYKYNYRDSLLIYDFRYADTTGPICFIVGENLILWDAGLSYLSLQGRGVFLRERYHVFR